LPFANRIDLTRVHAVIEGGDAFFPEFNGHSAAPRITAPRSGAAGVGAVDDGWKLISSERHEADKDHGFAYTFLVYEKLK